MKNKFLVLFLSVLSLTLIYSCDSFLTGPKSSDPEIDLSGLQLFAIPFPDANDPASVQLLEALQPKYVMNYSTLAPEENEKAYKYDRFELLLPPEVTQLAGDATRRVTVRFGMVNVDLNPNSAIIDDMEIIRTANYLIPDHDIAEEMLRQHLRKFDHDSALAKYMQTKVDFEITSEYEIIILNSDASVESRSRCFRIEWEWFCDEDFGCHWDLVCIALKDEVEEDDGGLPGDGGGDGDGDNNGGGDATPPDNQDDDDDPCAGQGGTDEDPDPGNPGDGGMPGGNGNHDGSGTMNMPECDPCTMPNPPSSCDDEEVTLTVNITPDYAGVVTPGSGQYEVGTQVTLTAQVNPSHSEGYVFSNWTGDVSGTGPTISFQIESDTFVTAEFIKVCDSVNAPEWCENKCENTGNELVDDLSERGMLNWIWESSDVGQFNSQSDQYNRREFGMFAQVFNNGENNYIRIPDDLPFALQQYVIQTNLILQISLPNSYIQSLRDTASDVVYIHTHPYYVGETQLFRFPDQPLYETAIGDKDKDALLDLVLNTGIIIDGDNILVYDKNGNKLDTIPRCGY